MFDDSRRFQNRQMTRCIRLRKAESVLQMTDAEFAVRKKGDDAESGFIA